MNAFNARCTGCGVELEVPAEYAGHTIACPQCSTQFVASPPAKRQQSTQPQAPQNPSSQQSPFDPLAQSQSRTQARSNPPSSAGQDPNPYGIGTGGQRSRKSNLPGKRTYPALETVRTAYVILAYITLIFGVIFILYQAYLMVQGFVPVISFVISLGVTIVITLFNFITLKAFAEGLKLMMDIQDNTLITARNSGR